MLFVLAVLAAWAVTHLLADEGGPGGFPLIRRASLRVLSWQAI